MLLPDSNAALGFPRIEPASPCLIRHRNALGAGRNGEVDGRQGHPADGTFAERLESGKRHGEQVSPSGDRGDRETAVGQALSFLLRRLTCGLRLQSYGCAFHRRTARIQHHGANIGLLYGLRVPRKEAKKKP